uniref:Cell 5A endo1 putative n=1 Tax=Albugo laibachii Nc14 TaxID=890382 RepID=F0W036_9STRA|nr:cell 5A endo1 putative [Albugo laibachii Nc14]|eukprot:CCA14407.1 cell 5A endo1 putative [Albugo laibachii Nc14]
MEGSSAQHPHDQYGELQTPMYTYSRLNPDNVDSARSSEITGGLTSDRVRIGNDVAVRGSLGDRGIEAYVPAEPISEKARDYKGRIRTWPGLLLLFLLLGASAIAVTYYAVQTRDSRDAQADRAAKYAFEEAQIEGGKGARGDELIADDGVIGNPKKYPPSTCYLPNYLSKNGKLYSVAPNGTEVEFVIKGVTWYVLQARTGMESGQYILLGLWENLLNGTSAYQIASFLSNNNFNAVRIPLMASAILRNSRPNANLINRQENRAVSIANYMSFLKSIITVLQFRKIGVVLSMQTLTPTDAGGLWFNSQVTEENFLLAIDKLTASLCTYQYWNVIGIDLTNEPHKATWGDESPTDFNVGARKIAARMLDGCPNWIGLVQGITGRQTVEVQGKAVNFTDWYGGGLQGVKSTGMHFSVANKVVYAPHFNSPAVYPQSIFYANGTWDEATGKLVGYVELNDASLQSRTSAMMDNMFGFLSSETGPAILMGQFSGLYGLDAHPLKTSKRVLDQIISVVSQPGWAGGFVMALNPETSFQYNPADTVGKFAEGVLSDDWLSANKPYLAALEKMDTMENLRKLPCFPRPSKLKGSK